jgi:hypothetical protein
VLLIEHWFYTRRVDHLPESVLRLARRHGIHGRIPLRSIAPLRAEWLSSPSCFGCGREGSSGRISGAAGTVLRLQDKSGSPFGQFAVVDQWVTTCRRKGGGAAFPENPIESMQIAPPIAVLGVLEGQKRDGGRQGKSSAGRSAYVVGIIESFSERPKTPLPAVSARTSMISTIRAPSAPHRGRKGGRVRPPAMIRGERTGGVRQFMVSYM